MGDDGEEFVFHLIELLQFNTSLFDLFLMLHQELVDSDSALALEASADLDSVEDSIFLSPPQEIIVIVANPIKNSFKFFKPLGIISCYYFISSGNR